MELTNSLAAKKEGKERVDGSNTSSDEKKCYRKYRRRCRVNRFYSSLQSTNLEKRLNAHKLRIRYLPEERNEDTKSIVIKTLNFSFRSFLVSSDIISCERVVGWDGKDNPRDIIITFKDLSTKENVFLVKNNYEVKFKVLEELGKERATIYADAVSIFGEDNVFTAYGLVFIATNGNCLHEIRTLLQFLAFLRKIAFCGNINCSQLWHPSNDSSSDEESTITYGYYNGKDKSAKTVRIRKIPEKPNENTSFVAIEYIFSKLQLDLGSRHIERCERVTPWNESSDTRDILVTFKNKHIRKIVYGKRASFSNGRSLILDELSHTVASVWTKAVEHFGENNVYTGSPKMVIIKHKEREHAIFSMDHFQKFVKHLE